jgi:protein TonB
MTSKKSEKANLDKKRWTFGLIGVVFALAILYVGFELFATKTEKTTMGGRDFDPTFDPNTPITDPATQKPAAVTPLKTFILKVSDKFINETFDPTDLFAGIDDPIFTGKVDTIEIITGHIDDLPVLPDIIPEFPGGFAKMYEYLRANLKYPSDAIAVGISGKVVLQFVVERDGSISNIKPLYTLFPSCDAEAIRVVQSMPKWIPGSVKGRPVRAYYTIPIAFILQ